MSGRCGIAGFGEPQPPAAGPGLERPRVTIVRTGAANLASVCAALKRIGATPELCDDADPIEAAALLVLPGVGAFGAAMTALHARNLAAPLRRRVLAGRPTLAICLGMQLLCAGSEETPGVAGLGVFDSQIVRFAEPLRVPQLGWNLIAPEAGKAAAVSPLLRPGFAYFANSYCLRTPPAGWHAALADYGGPFVAALERGPLLACQFHPELSGAWGQALLQRWLERAQQWTRGGLVPTC